MRMHFVFTKYFLNLWCPSNQFAIECWKTDIFVLFETRRLLESGEAVGAAVQVDEVDSVNTLKGRTGGVVAEILGLR